jgi:adenylate cyclase
MALVLTASGKPAEAVEAAQRAIRLDPSNRDFYSFPEGMAYMVMRSYEAAIPPLKRFLTRYPNSAGGHQVLVACHVELGRNEEAGAEAAEVMRINPQFSLAVQKQMSFFKEPQRDRLYADMAKAGLK